MIYNEQLSGQSVHTPYGLIEFDALGYAQVDGPTEDFLLRVPGYTRATKREARAPGKTRADKVMEQPSQPAPPEPVEEPIFPDPDGAGATDEQPDETIGDEQAEVEDDGLDEQEQEQESERLKVTYRRTQ